MHSSSSNSRASRQPHPAPPNAHSQTSLSSPFLQSPSDTHTKTIPPLFPTPQYDNPFGSMSISQPPTLSPPDWQRPRATSSYALESATLAFPEPQLYRATSTRAASRPPSPRASRHDLGTPHLTPALSHRSSVTGLKTLKTEVTFEQFHLEGYYSSVFSPST